MILEKLIDLITLVIMVAPVVIELVKYLGAAAHNKKVVTLAERAMIIVSSLDSLGITNESKKQEALNKLLSYATETKINLTVSQAEDYIEHSVQELRRLQSNTVKSEVLNNAPKNK